MLTWLALPNSLLKFAMNKPFSAKKTLSITELGHSTKAVVDAAKTAPIAVTDDSGTVAYLVPANLFEEMLEALEDMELAEIVKERRGGPTRKVSLDEL